MKSKPSILIFARSASVEAQTKWSHLPRKAAERLSAKLFQQTISTVKASGYSFLVVDESLQQGRHFGDRIYNAIETVLSTYDSTIIIGGDCPGLTTDSLHYAADRLHQYGLVLGPDRRGGVYLLGLTRSAFSSIGWSAIRWETSDAYQDLAIQQDHVLLRTLTDIHDGSDVSTSQYHGELSPSLAEALLANFVVKQPLVQLTFLSIRSIYKSSSQKRGPPTIAA